LGNTRNSESIIIVWIATILVIVDILYLFHYSPAAFTWLRIFQPPIEVIPLNGGWLGLVLIFVNGFLLSYFLVRDGIDNVERLLLSIGLGFGATYLELIFAGILLEISLLTVILSQVVLFILLLLAVFHRGMRFNFYGLRMSFCKPKFNFLEATLLVIISVYVGIAVYQTVAYPAIEWDSLAYGVNYAKIIFEKGRIPLIAGSSIGLEMSASYPPGVQLLAVYLYTFAGDVNDFYFRIIQPILGLAAMIATYRFAVIRTKSKTFSIFAVFILSAIPTFWEGFVHENYLMCLTLMLTLSAFYFFKAYYSSDSDAGRYEFVGTLFCCFSALTSYIGLSSFGILLLYAVSKRVSVERFARLFILASFIVLPWYMRNFILLGNPVYPFFGIGKYLDPLLLNSTLQHFQNWLKVPLFGLLSTVCKIAAAALLLTIVYIVFNDEKRFPLVFPFYLLLVGIATMAFHIPFLRYLIVALPVLAIILSVSIKSLFEANNIVGRVTAVIFVVLMVISSALVLPYINSFKPLSPVNGGDKWSYLCQVFEEADAWKWINENAPLNARIATYDIKEYYVEREILPLDGYEAAPLYKMNTIDEAISFLREKNVMYVLSVPWASPLDARMPPAYEWCILTRYLGDPQYLPPVYVGSKGAAVYHVGSVDEEKVYASFAAQNFAPPIKHVKINLTVVNEAGLTSGRFYIPVPTDYRGGLMTFSVNCTHGLDVELWKGMLPRNGDAGIFGDVEFVKKWSISCANSSGFEEAPFSWQIDKAGYFTFLVTCCEGVFEGSFNVDVDLEFYSYWEVACAEH